MKTGQLDAFLSDLRAAGAKDGALDEADRAALTLYLGEARIGLDLVAPFLKPGQRVLEIGSGIGALGHFLGRQGVDIHGIEPGGTGFDRMARLARFVSGTLEGPVAFRAADRTAESLNPDADGLFDLIFSVHVLEHVGDLDAALGAMTGVLKPGGQMVHLCPNYRFPYDPHFGLPLPFWSPGLARALFRRRIADHESVWNSLNFIGAGRLKRLARKSGLRAKFHRGVMASTFRRLNDDAVFRARHSGLAGQAAGWAAGGPLLALIDAVPPQWASPMAVTLERAG